MSQKLKITLVRSLIGTTAQQKGAIRVLGLRKIRQSVVRESKPELLGVLKQAAHLVRVEEVQS